MDRSSLANLPGPIAVAMLALLEEDLPRAADELAALVTVTVEYVAAVALADYLDGATDGSCAGDDVLNGWLASQLAAGKAEAGLWARWTKLAVRATRSGAVPALARYVEAEDLDDRQSDLAWLLAFRNRVMHGGFVAPLPQIRTAMARLRVWLASLREVLALRPVARVEGHGSTQWRDARGVEPVACDSPRIPRPEWDRPGAVLLVGDDGVARLALDPACVVDEHGRLGLQHAWQQAHPALFARAAISGFFARYQRERSGRVDATGWFESVASALPARGHVASPALEAALDDLLAPARVVRLVGPVGSGRSTLVHALATRGDRPFAVLPVEPNGVRQDPEVVARWTLQALATLALGEAVPVDALGSDGPTKRRDWFDALAAALAAKPAPILVVDDAELVGGGLYAGSATSACLRHARRFGATVLLVHTPAGAPPEPGDAALELAPLDDEALRAWGDPAELRAATAGHLELLADRARGRTRLQQRLVDAVRPSTLHRRALEALSQGPRTANEVAAALDAFTPRTELVLRELLDHLLVGARPGSIELVTSARIGRERSVRIATTERTYALHPAVALTLSELAR